ncbi:putative disease resistance protein RGA3 [Prunus yedoensis var. nudiflora]|uniref:Putative disease resistance protein RGA3 n=1 Tax=Prunus yedoensis var. nudiflora TaxID=2094558 RepID=A0A314UDL4_PRUYE|nr:putative disease resistance protein RGA3 [Prunus yedoensis var. nudiflora]
MSCLTKLDSAQGSNIIVTTRSAKVASITETLTRCGLENLYDDECWSILKDKAFLDGGASITPDLERIGRKIANSAKVASITETLPRCGLDIYQMMSVGQY